MIEKYQSWYLNLFVDFSVGHVISKKSHKIPVHLLTSNENFLSHCYITLPWIKHGKQPFRERLLYVNYLNTFLFNFNLFNGK